MPTLYITGASGFIGSALTNSFLGRGWHVFAQSRTSARHQSREQLTWCQGPEAVNQPVDLLINLAGKSLNTRWTQKQKEAFYDSRVGLTHRLVRSFAERTELAPRQVFSASAISYYAQGDEPRYEGDEKGCGFAATLCSDWESAAEGFERLGGRVNILRFGVVLDPCGGALGAMLPPFRLGLGARLGSGAHWFSWISLRDLVAIVHFLYESAPGHPLPNALNLVAPGPATNADFTRELALALRRPARLRAPAFLLRAALGEGADDFLLANLRIMPGELLKMSYAFVHPNLQKAFADFFGSSS